MKKKKHVNEIKEETFIISYIIPFFFAHSIAKMVTGYFYIGTYSITYEGLQARAIAFLFFLFGAKPFYDIYIKIPKTLKGHKIDQFKYIAYKSSFFYLLICTILIRIMLDYFDINYKMFIFIALLVINLISQFDFNKKLKKIIEM